MLLQSFTMMDFSKIQNLHITSTWVKWREHVRGMLAMIEFNVFALGSFVSPLYMGPGSNLDRARLRKKKTCRC